MRPKKGFALAKLWGMEENVALDSGHICKKQYDRSDNRHAPGIDNQNALGSGIGHGFD